MLATSPYYCDHPRYVSLQLVERFVQAGGGRLDIAEAEVYGWGRTCARDV